MARTTSSDSTETPVQNHCRLIWDNVQQFVCSLHSENKTMPGAGAGEEGERSSDGSLCGRAAAACFAATRSRGAITLTDCVYSLSGQGHDDIQSARSQVRRERLRM